MPETLTSQTRAIILSVSKVPLKPATEVAIVYCVAFFFYKEGKGGENFQKKNTFRCKVKREERSMQKLKDIKASDKSMTFTNTLIKLVLV